MKYLLYLTFLFSVLWCACEPVEQPTDSNNFPQSGAGLALDFWSLNRSYPKKQVNLRNFTQAYEFQQSIAQSRNDLANWEAIGPKNIAGRSLTLAFHPIDTNTIFLGSASGGLWKTTSAGLGKNAWKRMSIGFPVLAVSSIAISPLNPNVIYIGTGEMYNSSNTMPGIVNRLTRGTYGFGIFKSIDGGETWEKSLDWSYQEMRGVQDIIINPLNDQIIYAATSIGLLRSTNAGIDWTIIQEIPMAVDIAINPIDTNFIYVTYGSLFHENSGVYRSTDGGNTFDELRIGIPTSYSGQAQLAIDPVTPSIIFASIADAFQSLGLYRSSNNGDSWVEVNNEDVAEFQGWYSHDIAVNPRKTNEVIQVGINAWKSLNNGFFPKQQSFWFNARFGKNPVGRPDGPPDYVHSDIHQVIFHPLMENTVFLATDGGVFVSTDGGNSYASRNGGLQTTQFYANFSNSTTNPSLAIGGMQDNSTAIYTGEDAWTKVLVGDGMSTAIDPLDDNFIYGSAQFLNIFKSTDKGANFGDIAPGAIEPIFNAPFELAPSSPNIIYAGGRLIYKSSDRGVTWTTPNGDFLDEGNGILTIAIAPNNPDRLFVSTAPTVVEKAKVFGSKDGGRTWMQLLGLPDRLVTDIAFHPVAEDIAFLTYGGFNTFHVYQTINGGNNWFPIDNNLPDVPHNAIVLNPFEPNQIYLANDLGIFVSEDAGGTWQPFMNGLPETILAMHLSISPANERLRVATHGNGVFETDLIGKEISTNLPKTITPIFDLAQNFPNPVNHQTVIPFSLKTESQISLKIYDTKGQVVKSILENQFLQGQQQVTVQLNNLANGNYIYQLIGKTKEGKTFKASRKLVKYSE